MISTVMGIGYMYVWLTRIKVSPLEIQTNYILEGGGVIGESIFNLVMMIKILIFIRAYNCNLISLLNNISLSCYTAKAAFKKSPYILFILWNSESNVKYEFQNHSPQLCTVYYQYYNSKFISNCNSNLNDRIEYIAK